MKDQSLTLPDSVPSHLMPLPADLLRKRCDPAALGFATTAELSPLDQPLGQERAIKAVHFAIGMRSAGYNLFALGPEGTGKATLILDSLRKAAAARPAPNDWVYVHNFAEPHRPKALCLPPGRGPDFKRAMDQMVEELRQSIPAAFEAEEYRAKRQVLEEQFKESREGAFRDVQQRASKRGIAVIRTDRKSVV